MVHVCMQGVEVYLNLVLPILILPGMQQVSTYLPHRYLFFLCQLSLSLESGCGFQILTVAAMLMGIRSLLLNSSCTTNGSCTVSAESFFGHDGENIGVHTHQQCPSNLLVTLDNSQVTSGDVFGAHMGRQHSRKSDKPWDPLLSILNESSTQTADLPKW